MILALLLTVFTATLLQDKPVRWPPKKGDTVVARGCVTGGVVEGAELSSVDGEHSWPAAYDYRLTGKKELLKTLKDGHSGHADVITGVLKTDLPTDRKGLSGRIGNTGVGIGIGNAPASQQRALPVLEVESFEHVEVRCR